MNVTRGEIWMAELDPTQGSEQAGRRLGVLSETALLAVETKVRFTLGMS